MVPKLGVPTVALGWPKIGWFRRFKNSARNWSERASVKRKFLNVEKSTSPSGGPRILFRALLPCRYCGRLGLMVRFTKVAVLNQRFGPRWSLGTLVFPPILSG